ncbi:MAG: hypothetical protein A2Z11_01645 [Candidatus Woykebacteria bacterium RBG_16_43_9]|uniref:O-antigen ligase-related domain-containing protein n=1 Tax=Candidatus Woykebacteria bacterium RBG_16_43_9 TaxID=1802596 RepID=A0A1G1WHE8_9BACT|nr:MAG: hypothetical protein A2Z11_01645 [Candidatus Woykebacteria bacterium RBG_16_43_9]
MKLIQSLAAITLISLPLYVVRCRDFSWCSAPTPFTLLEVFILVTFFSWLIWRVYSVRNKIISTQKLFEGLRGPFFWPLVIFLGIGTLSMFVSSDLRSAAGIWKAYFVEPALLFIVVLDISVIRKSIAWALYSLLFSGFWVSSLAIWQSITKIDPFASESIISNRVTGVFDNPNALSLYLGPVSIIGLGFVFKIIRDKQSFNKKLLKLTLLIVGLLTFLFAIYLSKSRGAGIGLAASLVFFVGLILYTKLSVNLKKLGRRIFYLTVSVLLAFLAFGFLNIDRFVPAKAPKPLNTAYTRLCIWQATNRMLDDKFVMGAGLSGFPLVYPQYATCERHPFQYPHNIFLNFWVEMGVVGLLAFLWITYIYSKALSKHLNNFLAIGLLSTLAYIFVHGLVDVPYFKNDLSSQFWVLLAIAVWFDKSKVESV